MLSGKYHNKSRGIFSQFSIQGNSIIDYLIIVLSLLIFILKMDFQTVEINISSSNVGGSSVLLTLSLTGHIETMTEEGDQEGRRKEEQSTFPM